VDFSDRSAQMGHPPKVVWLCLGNCTTSEIEAVLRGRHRQILSFAENEEVGVFVVLG